MGIRHGCRWPSAERTPGGTGTGKCRCCPWRKHPFLAAPFGRRQVLVGCGEQGRAVFLRQFPGFPPKGHAVGPRNDGRPMGSVTVPTRGASRPAARTRRIRRGPKHGEPPQRCQPTVSWTCSQAWHSSVRPKGTVSLSPTVKRPAPRRVTRMPRRRPWRATSLLRSTAALRQSSLEAPVTDPDFDEHVSPVSMACPFGLGHRQDRVALRLLVQGPPFDPVRRDPQCVRGRGHLLDVAGPDGAPVLLDPHLPADQIIPFCEVAHDDAFPVVICWRGVPLRGLPPGVVARSRKDCHQRAHRGTAVPPIPPRTGRCNKRAAAADGGTASAFATEPSAATGPTDLPARARPSHDNRETGCRCARPENGPADGLEVSREGGRMRVAGGVVDASRRALPGDVRPLVSWRLRASGIRSGGTPAAGCPFALLWIRSSRARCGGPRPAVPRKVSIPSTNSRRE